MIRTLPGSVHVEGREFLYVEAEVDEPFEDLIEQSFAACADIAVPRSGGVIEEGVVIRVKDGTSFFGISYRGDIGGWRGTILGCCKISNRLTAFVRGDKFLVSNGNVLSLEELQVEFRDSNLKDH